MPDPCREHSDRQRGYRCGEYRENSPNRDRCARKNNRWTLKFRQTLFETLIEQTLEFCIGKEIQIRQRAAPGIGVLIGKVATVGLQLIYSKSGVECFAVGGYDALVQG